MSDFKENVEKLNVRGIVLSSVMTAFGLVVALERYHNSHGRLLTSKY